MNDTLSIKEILTNTIDAAELGSTARSFPRVASPKSNEAIRRSLHVDSLSPCDIRVAHQARSAKSSVQRSLFALDQVLTRKDALSNPISTTKFTVAFQTNIPADVTLAEFRAGAALLLGALLASDAELLTSIYNGES